VSRSIVTTEKSAGPWVRQRDGLIRLIGRDIDDWTRSLEDRILGMVQANRGGVEGVLGSIDALLIGEFAQISDILYQGLRRTWDNSWLFATRRFTASVPMVVWLVRLMPEKPLIATEAIAPTLSAENELQGIIDGKITGEAAREIIRKVEFPPPSKEQVDAVLDATSAADGLSAMQRIKTVTGPDLVRLRQVIRTGLSGGVIGASAVEDMAKRIRPIVGNDPGQTTGMNYRAKRIARTEGMRVAEVAQREMYGTCAYLLKGIRTMTAGDRKVRPEHRIWHNKLYRQAADGQYYHPTLGLLPDFPAGPNCRCYTVAELDSSLTRGAQRVQLGSYDKAMRRFRKQQQGVIG